MQRLLSFPGRPPADDFLIIKISPPGIFSENNPLILNHNHKNHKINSLPLRYFSIFLRLILMKRDANCTPTQPAPKEVLTTYQ